MKNVQRWLFILTLIFSGVLFAEPPKIDSIEIFKGDDENIISVNFFGIQEENITGFYLDNEDISTSVIALRDEGKTASGYNQESNVLSFEFFVDGKTLDLFMSKNTFAVKTNLSGDETSFNISDSDIFDMAKSIENSESENSTDSSLTYNKRSYGGSTVHLHGKVKVYQKNGSGFWADCTSGTVSGARVSVSGRNLYKTTESDAHGNYYLNINNNTDSSVYVSASTAIITEGRKYYGGKTVRVGNRTGQTYGYRKDIFIYVCRPWKWW